MADEPDQANKPDKRLIVTCTCSHISCPQHLSQQVDLSCAEIFIANLCMRCIVNCKYFQFQWFDFKNLCMYSNKLNLKLLFYFVFGKAIWNIFIRLLKVAHCKKGQFHHLKLPRPIFSGADLSSHSLTSSPSHPRSVTFWKVIQ